MCASIDFGSVSLSEYSADLQGQVLHLGDAELLEPIMDLGCGTEAALVGQLASAGKDVVGIDQRESTHPAVRVDDWLSAPLGLSKWGTVISHMGLSNHFLHHHLWPEGHPERYARRFMEVLASLRPGGTFIYAPGMPFLEQHLPEARYALRTWPVIGGEGVNELLKERYGVDVLYTCHITRLS